MRTRHWNGEYWYENRESIRRRVGRWLIWWGGWESSSPATYDENGLRISKRRWRFRKPWNGKIEKCPTPVSLLGHRITIYNFEVMVRLRHAYFVWHFRNGPHMYEPIGKGYAYISRNGTAAAAHTWLWGWHHVYTANFKTPPREYEQES